MNTACFWTRRTRERAHVSPLPSLGRKKFLELLDRVAGVEVGSCSRFIQIRKSNKCVRETSSSAFLQIDRTASKFCIKPCHDVSTRELRSREAPEASAHIHERDALAWDSSASLSAPLCEQRHPSRPSPDCLHPSRAAPTSLGCRCR